MILVAFLFVGISFVLIGFGISKFLAPKNPTPEKLLPYECGEEAIGSPHPIFNNRFYILALLFVLFEIELVFLLPIGIRMVSPPSAEISTKQWAILVCAEMSLFVVALGLGWWYALRKGWLDWEFNPTAPSEFKSPVPVQFYEEINKKYATHGK